MLHACLPGVRSDTKKRLVEGITAALDEAYHIPDVRIFLREYAPENVAQDGRLGLEPVRPVCFIEAPQLRSLDAKRKMGERINAFLAHAYEGIANVREILILHNEYPLENAASAGRLQSENLQVVEAMKNELESGMPAAQNAVLGSVAKPDVGKASGTFNMPRFLGGVFGIAIPRRGIRRSGRVSSAEAFNEGFALAIGAPAALSFAGAIAGMTLPGRRETALVRAGQQA
jgi:hypothetical protein